MNRGTLRAEESLLLLTLEPGEIPHFDRNDKIAYSFRSLLRRPSFDQVGICASPRALVKDEPAWRHEPPEDRAA